MNDKGLIVADYWQSNRELCNRGGDFIQGGFVCEFGKGAMGLLWVICGWMTWETP
ncbi:hypothetical protein [Phormidium sp. CCY1219]|uniref:hypothetical protein n=1 Tax=Phormidium sp. CCY1219 TaxID=2886104 RepID=UPI002D1F49C3|nr:hypothetical protein [Phormidium sp. CCY1219]MEB3831459.1 hypothetical protein [Phormidium sp. CCY1219]